MLEKLLELKAEANQLWRDTENTLPPLDARRVKALEGVEQFISIIDTYIAEEERRKKRASSAQRQEAKKK